MPVVCMATRQLSIMDYTRNRSTEMDILAREASIIERERSIGSREARASSAQRRANLKEATLKKRESEIAEKEEEQKQAQLEQRLNNERLVAMAGELADNALHVVSSRRKHARHDIDVGDNALMAIMQRSATRAFARALPPAQKMDVPDFSGLVIDMELVYAGSQRRR